MYIPLDDTWAIYIPLDDAWATYIPKTGIYTKYTTSCTKKNIGNHVQFATRKYNHNICVYIYHTSDAISMMLFYIMY